MQNLFLDLRLPSVSDTELHQAAGVPGSLNSLVNQGKPGENGQNPGFSVTFQQVISAAIKEPPTMLAEDSELPAGGNLLPDTPDMPDMPDMPDPDLPVEMAAPRIGNSENDPNILGRGMPAPVNDHMRFPQNINTMPAVSAPYFPMQPPPGKSGYPVQEPPVSFSSDFPGKELLTRPVVITTNTATTSMLNAQIALDVKPLDESQPVKHTPAEGNILARQSPLIRNDNYASSSGLQRQNALDLSLATDPRPVAIKADGITESPFPATSVAHRNSTALELAGQRVPDLLKTTTPQPMMSGVEGAPKDASGKGSAALPVQNHSIVAAPELARQNPVEVENTPRLQPAAIKPGGISAAVLAPAMAENHTTVASELPRQPLAVPQNFKNRQPLEPKAEKQIGIHGSKVISTAYFQNLMEMQRQPLQSMPAGGVPASIEQLPAARPENHTATSPVQPSLNLTGNSFSPAPASTATSLPAPGLQGISVPVGHAAWEQSMARQVLQAGQNQLQTLEIRLNPANLGTLNVHISLEADTANIVFSSHHAVVREAVEGAIPRLREMFNTSGINLGDVNVANQGAAEQQGRQSSQQHHAGQAAVATAAGQSEPVPDGIKETPKNPTEQLLDYYI